MSVVRKANDGERDGAMAHLGKQVARGLIDGHAGDAEEKTGWRGALQDAADLSRQDAGVLTIADEIHRAAHDITTPTAVCAYATATLEVISMGPGAWVLRGMLERAQASAD